MDAGGREDVEDGRRSGRLPPEGWRPPPRPAVVDVLRTIAVVGTAVPILVVRMATGARAQDRESRRQSTRQTATRLLDRLGIDLRIEGADTVPREGGLVFMWNQESHLDHFVLMAVLPRPVFSLYNNEVRRTPVYGEYLRRTGHVWVDRHDEAQWRPAIASAADRVRAGECAVVSPEGTRSWDGKLLPFKRGAFLLAEAAGRPIVCVTIRGGHARLPRGAAFVRPGQIRVAFSEPLESPAAGVEEWKQQIVRTFEDTGRRLG